MRSLPRAALVLALVAPARLAAQGDDTAPFILTLPASTRAHALGHAGVALTEPEAVFHNPAQLAVARGMSFSLTRYRSISNHATIATAMAFLGGGVGVGAHRLEFYVPDPETSRPRGGEGGLTLPDNVLVTNTGASLGYARTWQGFRLGVGARYVEQRAPDRRTSSTMLDIGVARNLAGVTVGFAAQHLGPKIELGDERFDLPRRYTLGAAFQNHQIGTWFDLGASVALPVYEDGSILPGGGVELTWIPIEGVSVTGRFGVRAVRRAAEFPTTAGAAFGFDNVLLEYAFQSFDTPGYAHRVGVRLAP
jgi:hypothetical protein